MEAAERNIEEHFGELQSRYRRTRQAAITEELLDIIAGFVSVGASDSETGSNVRTALSLR